MNHDYPNSGTKLPTTPSQKTIVIGLVGGIASGKSFVAKRLVELGAQLIDADAIAHDVLRQPLIVRSLIQLFGDMICSEDGSIDRSSLARLVFGGDPESQSRLKQLEGVVHPVIHAEAIRKLNTIISATDRPKAVVIDAPLLIEADWLPMCDLVLFVEADREVRLARAIARGWTAQEFARRESAQLSLQEKRKAATHVVHSEDETRLVADLRTVWAQL